MYRHLLVLTVIASASVVTIQPAAAQERDFSAVEIIPHHVAGGIYYLEGAGGNIGLSVGEDGVVMIDDQFAPLTGKILAAISKLNDGEIRFVINTHVHGDHVGGNENLGKMGILILARDEVRVRLEATAPAAALPVLTYNGSITIHLNGEEVHAFAVPPAHTDGDAYIHFLGSDIIHTGDVFRTTGYPFVDLNNGGTVAGMIEALDILIGLAGPDTKILPGHGSMTDVSEVRACRDMLADIVERARPLVARGLSYDELAAARVTADYDEKYGDPERLLRAVHAELSAAR